MDVVFQQVVWASDHQDKIAQLNERFRRTLCLCQSNSLFQILHYDVILEGMELSDYVFNDDWTPTLMNKVQDYVERTLKILQSDEFKNQQDVMKVVSKVVFAGVK